MAVTSGTRLGPYAIVAPLGAGGMGEVYRATDTNLDRAVAIKVLPASFALDADRVARFTREAKTLASLNHPNIAAIYGLEKTPDLTALVMELVEGEDLSAVIARRPIALPDALPLARQIADALEAAHEQGIIHRDLKPANIKVRPDGTVKVLDFGLAKALDAHVSGATADAMRSPTLSLHATQAGIVLGTAAYMAPEQARGRPVDRRADIWAFGAVLFEMLTGARAFKGEDITDTIVSVVTKEPEWRSAPNVTGDTDVWTYDVQRGAVARVPVEDKQDIPVWAPDGSRLAVSSAVSGSGNLLLIDPDGRLPSVRLTATLAAGGAPGSWTADGRALAFTATRFAPETGTGSLLRTRSIWVVERDGTPEPRQLLSEAAMPDISADLRWLAYTTTNVSPGQVYVQPYPALDHRVQVSTDGGSEPVWRRDGREMYYLQNVSAGGALKVRVMAVPITTTPTFSAGTPQVLFEGPFRSDGGSFRNYDVTPDGQRFLMVQEVQRPPARVSQMVLVQNWGEELKQKVPVTK